MLEECPICSHKRIERSKLDLPDRLEEVTYINGDEEE